MIKHTQTIRRQIADELLSVFDHFVGFALKGLKILRVPLILRKYCVAGNVNGLGRSSH